ncbi:manganese efflux pump MntP family protein [Colwellia echini]|uniref:Putative manganese efflux pump MntP n=1 Tax=Colwellia echini TaxID=1982103 RepID=A0ABY3MYE8_9GAMM|nr:manganese efflux pump MntP family protein [Colwellia echini]TYK66176.1 manganese efflux pump [Colwellia echini]
MIEIIILAIALSMDAFAVSIGLGAKHKDKAKSLAFMAAIYFGFFQGIMPLLGYIGGKSLLGLLASYASWIAFLLLVIIGIKMIYESFETDNADDIINITHRVMLILAIATSIDAMAAGFSLTVLAVDPLVACFIIGIMTFSFSWFGVIIGAKTGTWLETKAELLGGVTLILIGFKILLT